MGKKKRSPLIGQSQALSSQYGQAGQADVSQANQMTTNPTSSSLYKSLYGTEAGQMSQAYDTAAANTAARGRAAGFGYEQPVAQGAQSELRGREASAIGQLPGHIVPQVEAAAQQLGQRGLGQEQIGAQYWTGAAVPLEQQYQGYSLGYTPWWQNALMGGVGGGVGAGLSAALGAI